MFLRSFILCLLFLVTTSLHAQYFGQNKPRYSRFDFSVHQTDHFEIYSYLKSPDRLRELAAWSEEWYHLHQTVLDDTISFRNPLLFYNHHADFQQTNAIFGSISQGTGGVTEGFKNRVVMPLMMTRKATHHVLGHELVHAFQYHLVLYGDSTSLQNMGNLPLWIVEGLAEYLSIGRIDAHTSMWMRDAYLNGNLPTLQQLSNPRFFPYRYGQTFWSFFTGTFGDAAIRPFFLGVAQYGLEDACKLLLGMTLEDLSNLWINSLRTHFAQLLPDSSENRIGQPILTPDNAGQMNLSPVLSPNGKYVIFVSEKDLFSMDMYLAEARSGKILRKIASASREGHVDDFNTIESSATWSPNSREFAFVATSKGRNIIIIKDAARGRTTREITIPDLEAINYPAWSPDGRTLAFTGMVEGVSDIYLYELRTGRLRNLTQSPDSEIMPAWSADGTEIVYATDALAAQRGYFPSQWGFNLAISDVISGTREDLDFFPGAENLNPQFDAAGNLYFLSNRDGFRNIYQYDRTDETLYQRSNLVTGVSGITQYSPALTISFKRDRLLFTHYFDGRYDVYKTDLEDLPRIPVQSTDVDLTSATLPSGTGQGIDIVNNQMTRADQLSGDPVIMTKTPFKSRFKLDYIGGGGGVGVGVGNNTFGTGTALMGGVDMLFSDILGNHQIYTTLMLNGEITDVGGQVQYLNQKNPIGWGARILHIPFRSGISYYAGVDTVLFGGTPVLADRINTDIQRIFRTQGGLFAQYPFSPYQRIEVSSNLIRFGFREDRFIDYYSGGLYLGQNRERLPAPDGFNLYTAGGAYVGDRANWGLTAPLKGYRFRIGGEQYFGEWSFTEATVDGRRYFWLRPFTLALRGLHFGRYGGDADQLPMFIGDPTLVRGYSGRAFDYFDDFGLNTEDLIGSKLLVTNIEIRLPFTGPERLALIKSGFLLTDLNLFLDGGVAFSDWDNLWSPVEDTGVEPLLSAGVSLRVNLFGALILEPFYAWPLRKNSRAIFGLNFLPGY